MPNFLLKPFAHGIVMWKILSAATAAIPIKLNPIDKPYLSGTLCEIDKAIKATARTITKTKLTDKVNSEIVLHKAGLRCLTEAVSELMACEIWKGRNNMNPLAGIFERKPHVKSTCSASSDKLHHPVPGYPQVATNKLAQIWNIANISSAKTLGSARTSVREWFRKNSKSFI